MIKRFFIIPDPEGDNKTRSHHLLNWMIKPNGMATDHLNLFP
jgi:hypothetical protein